MMCFWVQHKKPMVESNSAVRPPYCMRNTLKLFFWPFHEMGTKLLTLLESAKNATFILHAFYACNVIFYAVCP